MTQADPNNLRIAFAGSPQFADIVLNNLIAAGILPVVVYTQPDRPQGRGRRVRPNPVKLSATAAQFPVEQPVTLRNADASSRLASYLPDILVVVAYGLILPAPILDVPRFGCLNVHASSLPRWRGAAPIERAYMAGDEKTGTCIMQMEEGLDTGPVYKHSEVAIKNHQEIESLELKLAEIGSRDLIAVLEEFRLAKATNSAPPTPAAQTKIGASYARKLTSEDRVLDCHQSALQVARKINALAARMPVRCRIAGKSAQLLAGEEVDVSTPAAAGTVGSISSLSTEGVTIQCATGRLLITRLKFEGGKGAVLDGTHLLNGFRQILTPGTTVS